MTFDLILAIQTYIIYENYELMQACNQPNRSTCVYQHAVSCANEEFGYRDTVCPENRNSTHHAGVLQLYKICCWFSGPIEALRDTTIRIKFDIKFR